MGPSILRTALACCGLRLGTVLLLNGVSLNQGKYCSGCSGKVIIAKGVLMGFIAPGFGAMRLQNELAFAFLTQCDFVTESPL
jgi:hypothetical protein